MNSYLETPYYPEFNRLTMEDRSTGKKILNPTKGYRGDPKIASSYTGATVLVDPDGTLRGIRLSTGEIVSDLRELYDRSSPGECIVVFNSFYLDILLKPLGEASCRIVYGTNNPASYKSLQIYHTLGRSITMQSNKKTVRINSLKSWFRLSPTMKKARRNVGLPPSNDPEEKQTLEIWNTMYEASKSLWPISNPAKIWGPTAISGPDLDRGLMRVDLKSVPLEAQEMAYNCIHAPWTEIFVKGTTPYAYDYDLNSAYPSELAKLFDISYLGGTWQRSSKYLRGSTYGFCLAEIEIYPTAKYSPIRMRIYKKTFSPTGSWTGYITKGEIDFVHRHNLGKVKVLDGWWFKLHKISRPFKSASLSYIYKRITAKEEGNKALSHILKNISTSIWGKFLQKQEDLEGNWTTAPSFCPIYACIAMNNTKLRIAEMAQKAGTVYSISVDGIVLSDEIENMSKDLKLDAEGPALIVGPLQYNMPGRSSSFNFKEIIEEHPESPFITLPATPRRTTMRESLETPGRFNLLGRITRSPIALKVSDNSSRSWTSRPIVARQLLEGMYTSSPIDATYAVIQSDLSEEDPMTKRSTDKKRFEKDLATNRLDKDA